MASEVRGSKTGHRRTTAQPTKKPNYLELESNYAGGLAYDVDIPVPIADYKHFQYPLAPEVFCGYRPTTLELQSILQLVSVSDVGPIVDLIDPVSAYPVRVPPSPAPEDAALLLGLIPGVEKHLNSEQQQEESPGAVGAPTEVSANGGSRKTTVDAIVDQFNIKSFVHPLKTHLTPTKVFEVLPHSRLWANRYIHAALQQVDNVPPDRPLVLKNLENVSQRLRNFALFEPLSTDSRKPQKSEQNGETAEHSKSPDDLYLEGDYQFVRDYIARFPEDQQLSSNLIFDLPQALQNQSQSSPVYFLPLRGPKLLFTRASAAHATEAKKSRAALRLVLRSPISSELEDDQTQLDMLRPTSPPTLPQVSDEEKSSSVQTPHSKSSSPTRNRSSRRKASSSEESSVSSGSRSSDGSDDGSSDDSDDSGSSVDSSRS